jgi:CRP-like cAMP-binding protein
LRKIPINTENMSIANTLLTKLSSESYMHIISKGETVMLTFGETLYETGTPIDYVYFPNDALISLLTTVDGDHALEVGLVGHEGMVGTALALGVNTSPMRVIVQGAGSAMRFNTAFFCKELENNTLLRKYIYLYIDALMAQIAQTAACSRFHVIEARLARWLLMTRDKVCVNHFFLTHEFLANMLGVRRVGVTKAANSLKKKKLIEYSRGNITLINPTGLALAACSCYEKLKDSQNLNTPQSILES